MDENQFGSFGSIAPDAMTAIREALNRRGLGDSVPALNQQSAASPSAAPMPVQPGGQMPQTQPIPQQMPQEIPQEVPQTTENAEAKLIVSALANRLKMLSSIESAGKV